MSRLVCIVRGLPSFFRQGCGQGKFPYPSSASLSLSLSLSLSRSLSHVISPCGATVPERRVETLLLKPFQGKGVSIILQAESHSLHSHTPAFWTHVAPDHCSGGIRAATSKGAACIDTTYFKLQWQAVAGIGGPATNSGKLYFCMRGLS